MAVPAIIECCNAIYTQIIGGDQGDGDEKEEIEPGQEHVFAFYDELTEEEREELDEDYDAIDVDKMESAFLAAMDHLDRSEDMHMCVAPHTLNFRLKKAPVAQPGANLASSYNTPEKIVKVWRNLGLDLFFKNRVAIVILSGGMDSRLGEGVPKGVLDIGLLSTKSIFQLYSERIRRLQHLVHRRFKRVCFVPLYIMCNKTNIDIIDDFFRENEFFGMREQDVLFFTQSYAPIMDKKGKFLLSSRSSLAKFPNGNGGVFWALNSEGMIADMKSRGATCCYVCGIDNLLTKVGDPVFLGFQDSMRSDVGIKCVQKLEPDEKLGCFMNQKLEKREDADGDGKMDTVTKVKPTVVEGWEMTEDSKKRKVGSHLEFSAGNLSQYFLKTEFMMHCANKMGKNWHAIEKVVPYMDPVTAELVQPEEKNAFRLEMFIFDCFDFANKVVGLQVLRDELAIVKQVGGENSPATALQAIGSLHQKWIEAAGGHFEVSTQCNDREDMKCEISPLVSYEGEDLAGNFPDTIRLPFYLPSRQEVSQFTSASLGKHKRPSVHYLEWESEYAQHELLTEIHGVLGEIMESAHDRSKDEYGGEAAEGEELLPDSARHEKLDGSASPRSPRGSGGDGDASPRGTRKHVKRRTEAAKDGGPQSPRGRKSEKKKEEEAGADEEAGNKDLAMEMTEDKPGSKERGSFMGAAGQGGTRESQARSSMKHGGARRMSLNFWKVPEQQ